MTPSTQDLTLRPVTDDEVRTFGRTLGIAFSGPGNDDEMIEFERPLLELDRTTGAFDGDDMVGTAGIFSFEMTVAGGTVPCAGVTWVSVLPTHRRRGLLTRMMRGQLDAVREAGREPIAALWASEASIYGRFGYGRASDELTLTIPRHGNRLRPVAGADDLRLRLVDGADHLDRTAPVYDHDRALRPGMVALRGPWEGYRLFWPERRRNGASELRTVVAEDASGTVRGYARYATRAGAEFGRSTTVVRELHAVDPAALSAVLGYVTDLDLTAETKLLARPVDDPVLAMLEDPRAASPTFGDALYVRVVDVPAALAARTYALPVDTVLEVRDERCSWNAGRWSLVGDPTGARCERTDAEPELRLDVRELGAAYLGGTTLVQLHGAGLVDELTPGAVATLSAAMRHDPAPWLPWIF